MERIRSFRYHNLTLLVLSCLAVYLLAKQPQVTRLLQSLGEYSYLGAFIGGILFVSTFTVALGVLILSTLAVTMSPVEIGIIAGAGAVVGDTLIFHFVRDNLLAEIEPIYDKLGGNHLTKLLHTRYFSWTVPVVGAAIIASPLPDEIGVTMLGIAKMKTRTFLLLSFVLNTAGIMFILTASSLFR